MLAVTFIVAGFFSAAMAKEAWADGQKRPEGAAPLFEVSTVGEMMDAIDDDVTVVLAPGTYDITEWLENEADLKKWEEGTEKRGLYYSEEYEGPALYICGYENLSIISADRDDPAKIICSPGHANVMNFSCCMNILLDSLSVGHYPDAGTCTGAVLYFERSEHITVSDSELYGCGIYGLITDSCDHITLLGCDVHDCSEGCVNAENSDLFSFIHTDFHDCTGYTQFNLDGAFTNIVGCHMENLQGIMTDTGDFYMAGNVIRNSFDDYSALYKEGSSKPDAASVSEWAEKTGEQEKEPASGTEETELIHYTVKSHPKEMQDEGKSLVGGNFYEIILSEEDKKKWPELSDTVDSLNRIAEYDLDGFIRMNTSDARTMADNSEYFNGFYNETQYQPERADSLAFSYTLMDTLDMGGAHPSFSYRSFNFDPESGRSIPLSDVVKDFEALPKILFTELSESEDYLGYYRNYPEGEQEFYDRTAGMLENKGEYLIWALDYEGIHVYYNNYALGSYALGAPSELISFEEYPDLFYDQYVYKGEVPLGDENMTFLNDAPLEKLESETQGVDTLPLYWAEDYYYPEGEENMIEQGYYYTSAGLYFVPEDQYPELYEALSQMNYEDQMTASLLLSGLKNSIKSNYKPKKDEYTEFSYRLERFLNRADETVLSFTEYDNLSGFEEGPSSEAWGVNFNPKTGERIDLMDVIVSKEDFLKAAKEKIEETDFYVDEWKSKAEELLESFLSKDELTGAPGGISFTIDYQGLTLIFNGTLTGFDDGPCTIFLSYKEYPELFNRIYSLAPLDYVIELATGEFEDIYWFDFDQDGKQEPFSVILDEDENGDDFRTVSARMGDSVFPLSDIPECYDINAFLMHENGMDFIYVETANDDAYHEVYVYEVNSEGLVYSGYADGAVKFMSRYPYEEGQDELPGYLPVNPGSFKMELTRDFIGSHWLTADYTASYNGVPSQISIMETFKPEDAWDLKASEDIEAEYTKGDPAEWDYESGTLKTGTAVMPYQVNEDTGTLILKTQDGVFWKLEIEKKSYHWEYEGKPLNEYFEGVTYFG